MLERYISEQYPFLMLVDTDTKEVRFSVLDGRTMEQQWPTAIKGELLDEMAQEYKRLRRRMGQ